MRIDCESDDSGRGQVTEHWLQKGFLSGPKDGEVISDYATLQSTEYRGDMQQTSCGLVGCGLLSEKRSALQPEYNDR